MYLHQSLVPHKAAASAVIDYLPLHTPLPVIVFGIEINNPHLCYHAINDSTGTLFSN
jgi:hypothetical protein